MLTRDDLVFAGSALRDPLFHPFSSLLAPDRTWPDEALRRTPPTDILETEAAMEVVSDVPGYRPEDIGVEANAGWLIVRGKREAHGYRGEFCRTFYLGDGVALDQASATLENGVLRVRIPKGATPPVKRIAVRVAGGAGEKPGLLDRVKRALSGVFKGKAG